MDFVTATAQWIGFVVMAATGVMAIALIATLAAEKVWRAWCSALALGNIEEALREWKDRHPEKAKAWVKRDGESA
jgi:endonuclease/exonuclease/phosphatase (EEP) superfamily protein YafD